MSRRGIRRGKVKETEQFAISQPTVIDLFDKLSTRSGRLYPRSPHVVKPLRTTRQRPASVGVPKDAHLASPLSSPVRTTSTEALDTKEGEEVTKYLTESVLKRKGRASVSIMQDTEEYMKMIYHNLLLYLYPYPESRIKIQKIVLQVYK